MSIGCQKLYRIDHSFLIVMDHCIDLCFSVRSLLCKKYHRKIQIQHPFHTVTVNVHTCQQHSGYPLLLHSLKQHLFFLPVSVRLTDHYCKAFLLTDTVDSFNACRNNRIGNVPHDHANDIRLICCQSFGKCVGFEPVPFYRIQNSLFQFRAYRLCIVDHSGYGSDGNLCLVCNVFNRNCHALFLRLSGKPFP